MKLALCIFVAALAVNGSAVVAQQQPEPAPAQTAPGGDTSALPDAPSACRPEYKPLTAGDKFKLFVKRTYSPGTIAGAMFSATWAQMWGDIPGYGGGMEGWGKRFGAALVDTETRSFFGTFFYPTLFKQDPRYYPSVKKGFMPRVWYAGTRVLRTRSDDGRDVWNYSEFAAAASTSALRNAYYPDLDRGFEETMYRIGGTFGSDLTSNLLREFWPDIRSLFRKHTPGKIKNIEKKIPDTVEQTIGGTVP